VNLTYSPIPDGTRFDPTKCDASDYGKACCEADVVEACVGHVTGCVDGCTGDALVNLTTFVGCYAGKTEGKCVSGTLQECASKAGVDASAVESCAADKALVKETMTKVADRSKRIVSVPTMKLNGKVQRNSPESAKEIKAALCKAGADAAC
jgi:hypothetical protein